MARGVYSGRSPPDQPAAEPCQPSRAGANGPRREEIAAAVAIAFLLFLLYARGACPTIYVGDSGELVAAVHTLGIPHPTGYPLYVLLGKLWTVALPIGSVAWRMSIFSAAAAAAACGFLYALARRLALPPVAALLAALLLAASPSFWGEANVQRVYALGAVFVVLATGAAVRFDERRDTRSLAAAFFLCGLGATNHAFMAVFALALIVFLLARAPRLVVQRQNLVAATGAFVLGLLPYLYLPLRSRMNPRLDWGNPETMPAFVDVLIRRDFWERAWIERPADLIAIAGNYLGSFSTELGWAGSALVFLGIAAGWRTRRPVGLCLLAMLANVAILAAHGSRSDLFLWHRYYIPSYVMAALLAGIGCEALLTRLPRALHLLPLAVPLLFLVRGFSVFDRSRYRLAEDFAHAVLRSVPPGGHLVASDDNVLFVLLYLQLVEHERPDVDVILQGVGGATLPPLRFEPTREPLFFTHHPNWNVPGLEIVPLGVVFRALRAGTPPPAPVIPALALDGEHDPRVPKDDLTRNLIGHFHYMLGVTFEERDWRRARAEFTTAAAAAPDNDTLFYNLGLIFARNGLLDDARLAFARCQEINPRHLASRSHPRAADRLAEVTAEAARLAAVERTFADDERLRATSPDTAAYHERLAALLAARGEAVAARGHRLRARELDLDPVSRSP